MELLVFSCHPSSCFLPPCGWRLPGLRQAWGGHFITVRMHANIPRVQSIRPQFVDAVEVRGERHPIGEISQILQTAEYGKSVL